MGEGVAPDGGDLRQRRAPPQGPGQEEAGHEEKGYHYIILDLPAGLRNRPDLYCFTGFGSKLFSRIRTRNRTFVFTENYRQKIKESSKYWCRKTFLKFFKCFFFKVLLKIP